MYNYKHEELKDLAKARIIDTLADGYYGYLCDLHNEVFNMDFEYTDDEEAKEMLNAYGVFEAVGYIKDYEQSNFGEVNTDLANPCAVANMLWYIVGEEALQELMEDSAECDELWSEELGEVENKLVLKIFLEKMEE